MKSRGAVLLQAPPWNPLAPPLGIAFLASYLQAHGWPALALDLNLLLRDAVHQHSARADLWLPSRNLCWCRPFYKNIVHPLIDPHLETLVDLLLESNPLLVGLSCTVASRDIAEEIAQVIRSRSPSTVLVAGGPGVFGARQQARFSRSCFDYLVEGEGEQTLLEMLQCVDAKEHEKIAKLPGVIPWRTAQNNPYAHYVPREQGTFSLPHPLLDEFDLARYDQQGIPLLLSRGCIRRCAFCSDSRIWPRFRSSPASAALEAMAYHVKKGRTTFQFRDLVINGDLRILEDLADGILRLGLDLQWSALATVRAELNPSLLAKLYQSGLRTLAFGIECFSDEVLFAMGKGYGAASAIDCLRRVSDVGIEAKYMLIAGFPSETVAHFEQTLTVLEKNPDIAAMADFVNVCARAPGSSLGDHPERFDVTPSLPFPSITWTAPQGNDYEARIDRMTSIAAVLARRGLDFVPGDALGLVGLPGFSTLPPGLRSLPSQLLGDSPEMRDDLDLAYAAMGPHFARSNWADPYRNRRAALRPDNSQSVCEETSPPNVSLRSNKTTVIARHAEIVRRVLSHLAHAPSSPTPGWELAFFETAGAGSDFVISASLQNGKKVVNLSIHPASTSQSPAQHAKVIFAPETPPKALGGDDALGKLVQLINHYLEREEQVRLTRNPSRSPRQPPT